MKIKQSKSLYKLMQRFADITISFILQGNLKRAERCLQLADKLLRTGNIIIRNAVSNVFVYALSRILDRRDEISRKTFAILPLSLKKEYELQVNSFGV